MRATAVSQLLTLAASRDDSPAAKSAKQDAVLLLGHWRAAEAVDLLVKDITYSPPWVVLRMNNPLSLYPAATALVEIGQPAPRAIIDRLVTPVSAEELKLFAFVLCGIDGKKLALARLEIELAKAAEDAPKSPRYAKPKMENLARLISVIQTTDFEDIKQRPRPPRKPAPSLQKP